MTKAQRIFPVEFFVFGPSAFGHFSRWRQFPFSWRAHTGERPAGKEPL